MNATSSFSLYQTDSFEKTLNISLQIILNKYFHLIHDYLKFFLENISNKNKQHIKFIIIRGLDTISNVFQHILYYTKNIDIAHFHTQKSFYFYIEFIQQISTDQNTFLQLTSRDAVMYVYKKTLFEINNEYRKKIELPTEEENKKWDQLNGCLKIYKMVFYKMINSDDFLLNHEKNKYFTHFYNINEQWIPLIFYDSIIEILQIFLCKINNKIENTEQYMDCIYLFITKIKNQSVNKEKIESNEFDEYLNKSNKKLIKWLFTES